MKFFSNLNPFKRRNLPIDLAFGENLQTIMSLATGSSKFGANMSANIAAAYACRTAISESVAMLPVVMYRKKADGNVEVVSDHPLAIGLRDSPNPTQDSFEFFEMMQLSLLDDGNCYAKILKNRNRQIAELWPIPIGQCEPKFNKDTKKIEYINRIDGKQEVLKPEEVLHIKYKTRDGVKGISPLRECSQSFELAGRLLEHGVNLFRNGTFTSGFLETPWDYKSDEDRKAFVDSFKKIFGSGNSGKVGLLEKGAKYSPLSMQNMRDAQFVESRQLSTSDIIQIYRMPPVMVQAMDKGASYASIEQLAIHFVQYTIQPWVTRWERAIKFRMLMQEDPNLYIRFNVSALIRGDLQSRTQAIVQQLQYGLMTINEGRVILDQTKLEDEYADVPMISHNLRPLDQLEETQNDSNKDKGPISEPGIPKIDEEARFRPLIEDLMQRCVRRERATFEQMARLSDDKEKHEKLERHTEIVRETLSSAVKAYKGDSSDGFELFISDYKNVARGFIGNEGARFSGNVEDEASAMTDLLFDRVKNG